MRPNIIRFISDDTSRQMLGYSGGNVLTPTIDSIAANGAVFNAFHCPSTVCMASRYAALTGHYCGRCPAPSFRKAFPADQPYSIGFNTHIIPGVEKTVGHVLQDAGYTTGYVGKWHTGPEEAALGTKWFNVDDDPADPAVDGKLTAHQERLCQQIRNNGFDFAGGISWGNPQPGDRQIRKLEVHNLEWMTHNALSFLDDCLGEVPVFLNYALTPIHGNGHIESLLTDPRLTPAGYLEDHLGCMPERAAIYERIIDAGLPFDFITAGALWMDDAIAAVMQKVRDAGQWDNTIFIYTSDHGACEDKSTIYQGGVHIPCVMQWPGVITFGRTISALCQNIDWLPTFAEIAGADVPDDIVVDGASLVPLLRGETHEVDGREDLYFEFGHTRGVRTPRWKYIAFRLPPDSLDKMKHGEYDRACDHNGHTFDVAKCLCVERHPDFFAADQLYDLTADPDETRNLAGDPVYADVLQEMQDRLRRYLHTFEHPFDLNRRQPFLTTDAFAELTLPYAGRDGLNDLRWWTRKWHHRPEDVLTTAERITR